MGTPLEQQLGQLQAECAGMRRELDELHDDVKAIRSAVDRAAGSWRFLLGVTSLAASAGAAATYIAAHVTGK